MAKKKVKAAPVEVPTEVQVAVQEGIAGRSADDDQVAASKPFPGTIIIERDEVVGGIKYKVTPQGRFRYAGQ